MQEKIITRGDLIAIDEYTFEIPQSFRSDMRVPARVFATSNMLDDIIGDRSIEQLINVATLPGIQKYALAMPDIHQGYGFPIGGVAATAIEEDGVISPGGIGYDINCGIRLLISNMTRQDLEPYMQQLATAIFHAVPSGVGKGGKLNFSLQEIDTVLHDGAQYMVRLGYGNESDLEYCEEHGCMAGADPDMVSGHAKKRGSDQIGTLGSGNHFLELQVVDEIYDTEAAQAFGLQRDHVAVMIHCGSRGLGHQVCTDYVRLMMSRLQDWGFVLPDRELVCAPFKTKEARDYFSAMVASANFAWSNRHVIGHWVRETFKTIVGSTVSLTTVYDISHNIGKIEEHKIDNRSVKVVMHRKGATRSFGPSWPGNPAKYRAVGQPVFIPGTMGTSSYVLAGNDESMEKTFGTTCHGAGRRLSRAKAKKTVRGSQLREELERRGIIVRSESDAGLAEEAPIAYKDVDNVVNVVDGAKLARKVVRLKPIAVIKGS